MKKIFALILVVLMLIPFVVACGEETTTTTTTTAAPTGPFTSKDTVLKTWDGKTLKVSAACWYGSGAPWAIPEVFITETSDANFGLDIHEAVLEKADYVKDTYGVTLQYFKGASAGMTSAIQTAQNAGTDNWDIIMPRAFDVHSIVAAGLIYDLAGREYIDFDNTYYNDLSIKTWTAKGHTFFVTGGFTTLDKQLAAVLYFNKTLLDEKNGAGSAEALYDDVRNGNWTWNKLVSLANGAYADNGNGVYDDGDSFGINIYSSDKYFQYFGIPQAAVNEATGNWELVLNTTKTKAVVDAIVTVNNASWKNNFGGDWGASAAQALKDGRLLFYNEVLQKIDQGEADGMIGLVPFPKINGSQDRYYAPVSDQMCPVMAIPKITQDRTMSDYFFDVISWTGEEYLVASYVDMKADRLHSDVEVEMLTDYIIPNVSYNGGYGFGSWGGNDIMEKAGAALNVFYKNGDAFGNNFAAKYAELESALQAAVAALNTSWGNYTDSLVEQQ